MKAVKAHLQTTNPDRVPVFEKKAAEFAKKVVTNFKDYEFYTGESMVSSPSCESRADACRTPTAWSRCSTTARTERRRTLSCGRTGSRSAFAAPFCRADWRRVKL